MPTLLYKAAVRDLRGEHLLPLNQIRDRYPDLYDREVAKYAAWPEVTRHPVHPLACTWNDVLFFSPVHPGPIFDAIRASGRGVPALDYWTLDANLLPADRTCIRLMRYDPTHSAPGPEDFVPYSVRTVAELSSPSETALRRLRSLTADEPLLPWADIPHVLFRGSLPVSLFRDRSGRPVAQATGNA
ncbi:hypothetical protein Kfla_6485 [Kribbella flavida DSM 17836]|uniref:Uncharacterized protein n=1 Tax=Kribbella flavida (strain DSM 17836 / JCM 10339 / NBRC 14399) TaxID=479435 RepID=D2PYB4_KRIFD|nr:hypothetical protein [Kribbella flavida]ADB35482.1 hypothetical protein Kfla_6485 [Kribbella flavida DSM 17836]